jgi:hypothetical protein
LLRTNIQLTDWLHKIPTWNFDHFATQNFSHDVGTIGGGYG